jgi:hypothetical protein
LALEPYIVCLENCTLKQIEALAMIGIIVEAKLEDCNKPRFKRVVAKLYDNREVYTTCYFDEEAMQSLKIINIYIDFAKKKGAIGKLTVIETKPEE